MNERVLRGETAALGGEGGGLGAEAGEEGRSGGGGVSIARRDSGMSESR